MTFTYIIIGIAMVIAILGLLNVVSLLEKIAVGLAVLVAWPLIILALIVLGGCILFDLLLRFVEDKFSHWNE